MISEQKDKFEENICELLLKTSTRARSGPCMPSLHRTPAATAATGPVSSNTRRRLYRRLGCLTSGRESKDPFTSDRVRPSSVRGISIGRVREVVAKVFLESHRRGKEGSNVDLGRRRRFSRGRRRLRHHQGEAQPPTRSPFSSGPFSFLFEIEVQF